jgi:hypothetical protein
MAGADVAALRELAHACERLNDFARTLDRTGRFKSVTTSTDLRSYLTGWAFEKYVEASLPGEDPLTAVWMLELRATEGGLELTANGSISHGDYDQDLHAEQVKSEDLGAALERTVAALVGSYGDDQRFRQEVDRVGAN